MAKEENRYRLKRHTVPEGILVAIGGNEDKVYDLDILSEIASLSGAEVPRIEVITTATAEPEEMGETYYKAFKKVAKTSVGIMHILSRHQANDSKLMHRVRRANIVFFCGGDQLRITSILGGSRVLREIHRRYFEEYCVIAGTSAGASAMSEAMIFGGESSEALLKGTVNITGGIGLICEVIIDTHFIRRGRISRLMQAVCMNPGFVGIGLGEDAGVVISRGHTLRVIGSGLTIVLDGQHIRYSNVADIQNGEAIAIDNLVIHALIKGYGYDLWDKKYLMPDNVALSP